MNKVLIELIITNQCNKRCEYCDLDFRDKYINDDTIKFFTKFINDNKQDYFHINFFGGEPLLKFEKVKNIINNINRGNIKYSIGTNGNLLNKEILDFLYKKKVNISLSVDNITGFKNIFNIDKKYFDIIEINFINDPNFLFNSYSIFLQIIEKGFFNINFMPVFSTKKRIREDIILLGKILKKIRTFKEIDIKTFSYFNGISNDTQFILDTDGFLYNDLDSLLWLQKQYNDLSKSLRDEINNLTKNISINDKNISLEKILNGYNLSNVINLVKKIPLYQGYDGDYKILNQILKNVK